INFSLHCKPGFDVGVQSVLTYGLVFPGQLHVLNTIAGDMSHWYNLNCASGISGQVQITVTGPVTFVGILTGALTPVVSGNIYTYNIADFGVVNNMTAFNMAFATNSNAHAGDTICVSIAVTPTSGDNNLSNNNMAFCYYVINSHDPNRKDVYPVDVPQGYQNWFTYTIQFQNTGTAPAIDIQVTDSLDNNLDLKTLQVINYSHNNTVSLNGNFLTFNFHNINLPDSVSNPQGSIGYVQYRIKPKANRPAGTKIYNSASIYFDYNWAIVTDTTINTFVASLGIDQISNIGKVNIYPNPTNGNFIIETNTTEKQTIEIFDVAGKMVLNQSINGKTNIEASNLDNGMYFIQVKTNDNIYTQKIIVQH
ncbi:MAG TPA: T9SS type A sorting domain-containing protein, partial [Bacteroidia bacterium]|nr:T9SS type A sorting domain-containing protein [Bacteroidia bacterium]